MSPETKGGTVILPCSKAASRSEEDTLAAAWLPLGLCLPAGISNPDPLSRLPLTPSCHKATAYYDFFSTVYSASQNVLFLTPGSKLYFKIMIRPGSRSRFLQDHPNLFPGPYLVILKNENMSHKQDILIPGLCLLVPPVSPSQLHSWPMPDLRGRTSKMCDFSRRL